MSDHPLTAQQLLERARRGHDPEVADARRVRAALHARALANPLLLSATSASSAHALAAGKLGLATNKLLLIKLALAVSLCGGATLVGAVVVSQRTAGHEAEAAPLGHTARAASAPLRALPAPTPNSAADALEAAEAPKADEAPPVTSAAVGTSPRKAGAVPNASGRLSAKDLQVELAGLARAQQLLHGGNAVRSLSALDELAREVPQGRLMEERDATRALATCALDRSNQAALDGFVTRYPSSVHASRVRSACRRSGSD